ncbi:MAG: MBL fold metallo-hydrolase, partial [Ruminiclostridium sp.]
MYKCNILQIIPEVTLIEDTDTCIYVVEGDTSAIVIDTGYGFCNLKKTVEEITKKPLIVVCTHGHIDHAFGAHYFDKIYMNRDDMPIYEKHNQLKRAMKNKIISEKNITADEFEAWCKATVKEIKFVSQGSTFDIGGNVLEVISLRGHTPGSIGILDRKHRILFSGYGIIAHVWMQLPESTTLLEYLETVRAVKPFCRDFDTIYMGHRKNYKSVSFIDKLEDVLNDILVGCTGKTYNNEIFSG